MNSSGTQSPQNGSNSSSVERDPRPIYIAISGISIMTASFSVYGAITYQSQRVFSIISAIAFAIFSVFLFYLGVPYVYEKIKAAQLKKAKAQEFNKEVNEKLLKTTSKVDYKTLAE